MDERNFILCSESETKTSKFVNLTIKSVKGIISASKTREYIHEILEPLSDNPLRISTCFEMSFYYSDLFGSVNATR